MNLPWLPFATEFTEDTEGKALHFNHFATLSPARLFFVVSLWLSSALIYHDGTTKILEYAGFDAALRQVVFVSPFFGYDGVGIEIDSIRA